MSLLEALAVQRNVIATDIAGHRDIVPTGLTHPTYYPRADVGGLGELLRTEFDLDPTSHPLSDPEVREAGREEWVADLSEKLDWVTSKGLK